MTSQEPVYTPAEVAERLRVHTNTILKELKQGAIRGWRVRKRWRIPESALTEYLSKGQKGQEGLRTDT
ncbi:MAG: helix-turn-helix domain-containing protein [Acidobacterium ailaaui]|jgi:excisionase family DNA binding protein|nr:helix-turn-helix domain-containing protein [Pseudacidobacterium ailaaui]